MINDFDHNFIILLLMENLYLRIFLYEEKNKISVDNFNFKNDLNLIVKIHYTFLTML